MREPVRNRIELIGIDQKINDKRDGNQDEQPIPHGRPLSFVDPVGQPVPVNVRSSELIQTPRLGCGSVWIYTPIFALAARRGRLHIERMDNVKITCSCGAVYEVIETQGPRREPNEFKCLVCEKELFTWAGSNVGQFHLVAQPKPDRD